MNLLSVLLVAGNWKGTINNFISQYALPVFALAMFMGIVIGVAANWEKINDKSGDGSKREGLVNLAWIIGYVIVGIAVLGVCASQLANITFSI